MELVMEIEGVYTIRGHKTIVVIGLVECEELRLGEKVDVVSGSKTYADCTVIGLEQIYKSDMQHAFAGDMVELILSNLGADVCCGFKIYRVNPGIGNYCI
jgi:translation elongation factor EF-Tu-like GTPase